MDGEWFDTSKGCRLPRTNEPRPYVCTLSAAGKRAAPQLLADLSGKSVRACAVILSLLHLWPFLASASSPVIADFDPKSATEGTVVRISGTGFGATPEENTVTLGGDVAYGAKLLRVVQASPEELSVVVPNNARTSKICLTVDGTTVLSTDFLRIAPVIRNISPSRARPGSSLQILGKNFSPVAADNSLSFNGIPAIVTSASSDRLTTTVPDGATTGAVEVRTGDLSGFSSWPFEVLPTALEIDGINPGIATVGSSVTLIGKFFDPNNAGNHVFLNGIPAQVTDASFEALTFTVPNGASSGPITLSASGQTATSAMSFLVAQPGTTLAADGEIKFIATSSAGQFIDLTFSAAVGDDLGLGVSEVIQTPVSSSKKPKVTVFRPDNSVHTTATCQTQCIFDLKNLPATGTYTVRVYANNPSSTLSAMVGLSHTVESSMTEGEQLDLQMDRFGRIIKLQFSGVAGQSRSLELLKSSDPLSAIRNRIEVLRANGSFLYSEGNSLKCPGYHCPGSYLMENLPDTDNYTLIIQQSDGMNESLRVSLVEPVMLEVDGRSKPGQANFAYQMGLMSFPAMAGQNIDVGVIVPISANFITSTYQANWVRVSVFDPAGARIKDIPSCEGGVPDRGVTA